MLEAKKLELIHWISEVRDLKTIKDVDKIRNKTKKKLTGKRKFGSGKGLILHVSDDFDAPLDAFKEYTK
jgi:hypothetical protein